MKEIHLACNWSLPLKELLEDNEVKLDYIKTGVYGRFHEDFANMLLLRPVILHGFGYNEHTGMDNIEDIDFDYINNLTVKCKLPHIGIHLFIKNSERRVMDDNQIFEFMSKQTHIFKEKLNVPLLLENSPDSNEEHEVFDIYPQVESEFITKFVEHNDTDFLLDIAHAKVAALYRGWDIKEYIFKLPLERCKEIHVSGTGYDEHRLPIDAHQAMQQEDYELLEWVLEQTSPDILTLEYSGVKEESSSAVKENLVKQITVLKKILERDS